MLHVYDLDSELPKFELFDSGLLQELQNIYDKKFAIEDGANLQARIAIRIYVKKIKAKRIAEKETESDEAQKADESRTINEKQL